MAASNTQRSVRRIVVGLDFSELSIAAARWTARHLADGAELVLAHAIHVPAPPGFLRGLQPPVEPVIEAARRGAEVRLREIAATLGGVRIWPEIREGRPDEVLIAVATKYDAELLVIGPHGDRPGLGNILGGTAERMAREAPTSVLLARGLKEDGPLRVLVALEESPVNDAVFDWVKRLQRGAPLGVAALHVVNPMIAGALMRGPESALAEEQVRRRAEQWLREVLATHGIDGATNVAFGDSGFEILSAADRTSADLIVLGRRSPGRGRSAGIGGTAAFIMRNGRGSVLLVAPPGVD